VHLCKPEGSHHLFLRSRLPWLALPHGKPNNPSAAPRMGPRGRSFCSPLVESWCGQDDANPLGDLVQESLLHRHDGVVEGDIFSDMQSDNNVRVGL
jgi:hypothetical protein